MKITLPQVGESVTEAIIERWLKQVGDRVEKYEPLVEVVTDKVSMEIPSPADGIVTEILAPAGRTVPMGAVIAEIEAESDAAQEPGLDDSPLEHAQIAPQPMDRIGTLDKAATNVGPTGSGGPITTGVDPDQPAHRPRFSPAVMRLAELHGIDLDRVVGTGLNGRVTRKDVQMFIEATAFPDEPSSSAPSDDERVILPPVRRMIAENMVRSASQIPEAWLSMEVDVTNIVIARERIKGEFQRREGVRFTPLAFMLEAVAEALKANPLCNSTWDGDAIVLKKQIDIGIAVAAPKGLIVPVIRDADRLSVSGLARAIDYLARKARQNDLDIADVQGGTFTVNNTGALGSVAGKGIINYPQAAILNTESIVKRPVIVGDAIAIRSMMNLCLTFDHRILDGAEAGAFVADIKRRLESTAPDLEI